MAVLVERGYAGTTTPRIVKRAGVSQGALFKHFSTETDLLIATTEFLFDGLLDGFRTSLGRAVERHHRNMRAVAAQLFSRELEDDVLDVVVPGAIAMMNGAALMAPLSGDDSSAPGFLLRVVKAVEEGSF